MKRFFGGVGGACGDIVAVCKRGWVLILGSGALTVWALGRPMWDVLYANSAWHWPPQWWWLAVAGCYIVAAHVVLRDRRLGPAATGITGTEATALLGDQVTKVLTLEHAQGLDYEATMAVGGQAEALRIRVTRPAVEGTALTIPEE